LALRASASQPPQSGVLDRQCPCSVDPVWRFREPRVHAAHQEARMADRYQPYEDDYGREWRGRYRDRDDVYRSRDREDWRGREEDWRGRERERGWREDWRRGEPEWRGSREFRAGDRSWRGEGEPYGHQRGEMTYRGTWDRGRYP